MYRINALVAIIVTCTALILPYSAQANLLIDPGCESGTSWTTWSDIHYIGWATRTGTNGLGMYGWTGGGGAFQNVAADGESNYTFSAWGYKETAFSSAYSVELKIEFVNAGGTTISVAQKTITGSNDVWVLYSLTATAPVGTHIVRPVLAFGGTAGSGGGFKWDDASLTSEAISTETLTHYVSPAGDNTHPYSNWATAAHSIQSAVSASEAGDTVFVGDGTYSITSQILVDRGVTIRSTNGAAAAIVNAGNNCRVFYVTDPGAVIDGLTITNGRPVMVDSNNFGAGVCFLNGGMLRNSIISGNTATGQTANGGYGYPRGGGVYCAVTGLIENCVIAGNTVIGGEAYGGGLYSDGGVQVVNCSFFQNTAKGGINWFYYGRGGVGAGAYVMNGGRVESCRISNNTAEATSSMYPGGASGAGIHCMSATVSRCVIANNTAISGGLSSYGDGTASGGGASLDFGGRLENCLVVDNTTTGSFSGADLFGGGVYAYGDNTRIENCTIADNHAPSTSAMGGGLYASTGPTIVNTIIWNNTGGPSFNENWYVFSYATFAYSCTTPQPLGDGNLGDGPAFVDRPAGNYRLAAGSPCVNRGTNQAWMIGAKDLDGFDRIRGGTVDIGVYESSLDGNLLRNADFESDSEWILADDLHYHGYAARNGTNGLSMYGWTDGGMAYQDSPAVGASNYTFTVYGAKENNFLLYQLWCELRIEFYTDATASEQLAAYTNRIDYAPEEWTLYGLSAPAPAGAGMIRTIMIFGGTPWVSGAFKWDDARLFTDSNPEPVHYVSKTGSNVFPYTSWATAAREIQAGVSAALNGDTVLVSNGNYFIDWPISVDRPLSIQSMNGAFETYVYGSGKTRGFSLTRPGTILDGFTIRDCCVFGGVTNLGAGVYSVGSTIRNCTLESNRLYGGPGGDWVIYPLLGAGAYLVGGSLENCTVQYNMATNGRPCGAGVFASDGARVSGCLIQGNEAVGGGYAGGYYGNGANGAGIYALNGCTIQSSRIVDNRAIGVYGYYGAGSALGAGVYCSSGTVLDCTVSNNYATGADQGRGSGTGGFGAGIYAIGGTRVDRCIVTHNTTKGGDSPSSWDGGSTAGGGIYGWDATIWNCLVKANTATGGYGNGGYGGSADGGGIYCGNGQVANCTIVDNTAVGGIGSYGNGAVRGGGLYDANAPAINCIAYFNTALSNANVYLSGSASASYFCTTPDPGGAGHVTGDPLFQNRTAGNYRVLPSSPCVDAGTVIAGLTIDLTGLPRPLDGNNDGVAAYDIGAYEFLNPLADSDHDGLRDTNELAGSTSAVVFDTDGDGMGDFAELRAGTGPNDPSSFFDVYEVTRSDGPAGGFIIRWSSVGGKQYTLCRSTNLLNGFASPFQNIAATPPINTFTDTTATASSPYYYKVRVE